MSYIIAAISYVLLLLAGLGLAGLGAWGNHPVLLNPTTLSICSMALLAAATYVAGMMIAGILFPQEWRQGRMRPKDLARWNAFEGQEGSGPRISLWPSRVFTQSSGQLRQWDGLLVLLLAGLLLVHQAGGLTLSQRTSVLLPGPIKLTWGLHQSFLSNLPLMQSWEETWRDDPQLGQRVAREWGNTPPQVTDNAGLFRLAQLHLLMAFPHRKDTHAPFLVAPDDTVGYDLAQGQQAMNYLEQILKKPVGMRVGWNGGANALAAFILYSEGKLDEAQARISQAIAQFEHMNKSGMDPAMINLLSIRLQIQQGQYEEALTQAEALRRSEYLSRQLFPLVLEQKAEIHRLQGQTTPLRDELNEVSFQYQKMNNKAGMARVHMQAAAYNVAQEMERAAQREMSLAVSQASGVGDGFTLNMAGLFPRQLPKN